MAVIDYEKKEVNAKIVYYGPGLSGKTSNIHYIYGKLMPQHRGELMTLSTKSHRTLFFDFLPVELGEVKGMNTRFFLYTVPGQVFYNNIRKQILQDVDGIVFVADSQAKFKNDNIQSLQNLEENLSEQGKSLKNIPHVITYNKRDMPDIQTIEDLHRQLNKYNAPFFESVAINGDGVLKALTTISKMVLKKLREASSLQTKTEHEGPEEAYGLSDEFIAMKASEAEKLKAEMGDREEEMPPEIPEETEAPAPPPEQPMAPSPPPPVAPEPEQRAENFPPEAQSVPEPPPPAAAEPPPPPAPAQQAAPPPPPPPAPQAPPASAQPEAQKAEPACELAPSGQLQVSRWGNPQLKAGGVLKLPVVFKDPATGKEYTTTISVQVSPLIPCK